MYQRQSIINQTKLFQQLSKAELDSLSSQFSVAYFKPGDLIIKEGDLGDQLYVIESGAVRVFTYNQKGQEIVLARLESGSYFGEQALLTALPIRRNASVRALTEVKALTLSHENFLKSLKANEKLLHLLKEQGKEELITKLTSQLQESEADQKELLSLFSCIKDFGEREVLFWEGDEAKYAYYLLSGKVEIRFYDENKRIKFRTTIFPGQFFGELGILKNQPYSGTAVALTDVQMAMIQSDMFREFYEKKTKLHELIDTKIRLYQLPSIGLVTQFQGHFLNQSSINTVVQKSNGDIVTASRIINSDIFSVSYSNQGDFKKEFFQDSENHAREIALTDNRLTGAVSIGHWDDLDLIYRAVYEKVYLSNDALDAFRQSGKIITAVRGIYAKEANICECMQVKFKNIQDLMHEGYTTYDEISKKTAAGTVCGCCRPRIIEILGGEAWTYVKIINIRKHHDNVRSYQLQPIKGSVISSRPGQHIVIEAQIDDLWINRSYTLTSVDSKKNYYEITVKRENLGLFSRWLFEHDQVCPTPVLRVSAPQGEFIFNEEAETPAICFVAGIGVTPAIAFGRTLMSSSQKKTLSIDYSIHQRSDMTFIDELTNWPKLHSNLFVKIRTTSQEGRIQEKDIKELLEHFPNADIYICGPKDYEKTVTETLLKLGVKQNRVHLERFTHAGEPIHLKSKDSYA